MGQAALCSGPGEGGGMTLRILKSDDGETVERTEAEIFEGGRVWGRSLTGSH